MEETLLLSIESVDTPKKSSLRVRADQAKQLRCRTLICVLENPSNVNNLATIMRNIDALGVSRLYVISNDDKIVCPSNKVIRRLINPLSSSAYKWIFILSITTGIVLHFIAEQRRQFSFMKNARKRLIKII